MIVSYDKLLTSRIYFADALQCNMDSAEHKHFAVVSDPKNDNDFTTTLACLKFVPTGKKYVYFPETLLNPASLAPVSAAKERNSFYTWLAASRTHGGSFVKLPKLELTETQAKDSSPVVVYLSSYLKAMDAYAESHKSSAASKYGYYKMALGRILPQYLLDAGKRLTVLVNTKDQEAPPSLLFFILYGMRHDYAGMSATLKGADIVLADSANGIFLKLDLENDKKVSAVRGLISKMIAASKAAAVGSKELEAVTGDPKEADAVIDKFSVDKTAADDEAPAPETADKSASSMDPSSIDSIGVAKDSDLNEIIGASATAEFEQVKEENEKFLAKYSGLQERALAKFEAEAKAAATDKDLTIDVVKDDTVMNDHMKSSVIKSITSSYYQKMYKADLLACFKSLNADIDHPVVITSLEMKDNSDPLNMKDELSVQMLDKRGKRHNFTVDIPKISYDGFLYLNGNKKFITKQATQLPIIKESMDRVQITTNYAKTFLYRKNDKTSGVLDRLLKVFVGKKFSGVRQVVGNSFTSNLGYDVSIPYSVFSRRLYSIELGKESTLLVCFSQKKIREDLKDYPIPAGFNPVAYRQTSGKVDTVYLESIKDRSIEIRSVRGDVKKGSFTNISSMMVDVIRNSDNKALQDAYANVNAGKALGNTEIRLAGATMSLGVLLSFYRGLRETLESYHIKYTIVDKVPRLNDNEIALRFKDATIVIDTEGDTSKELLVNGFYYLNPKEYSLADSDRKGAMYLEYFGDYAGSRNIAKGLLNFESSMIDPITLDVLRDLKLPENFIDLLLLGNTMLSDYTHKRKNDMSNFRVRDAEVISVAVYGTLMKSFNEYKRTVKTGVVTPISAPRDAVTKTLQSYQCIEDYSILSPFLEIQTQAKTTFKGPSGLNSDDSYTAEIRSFDDSMIGVFGVFTPVSGQVGISRSLTLNPRIGHIRGYLNKPDVDSMSMDNLYAPGELLNIFTASHSDPMRIEYTSAQIFLS